MQIFTILLSLLATSTITVAQTPNGPCYGNVSYCAGGPIILRCSGTSLGPGNCEDNLNHPQYGALCTQSNSTAGNAICSAVGSSASPFPTVSGGLGTPTISSSVAAPTTSSVTSSASTGGAGTTTVTITVNTCPNSGTALTTTSGIASTASAVAVTSTVTSSAAASVTVSPTTTKSATPSTFTGAAVSMVRAGKDVFGLVIAGVVLVSTLMACGGTLWLLD